MQMFLEAASQGMLNTTAQEDKSQSELVADSNKKPPKSHRSVRVVTTPKQRPKSAQ